MKYKIIVIDPPWEVKKIIRRVRPKQKASLDYKTMAIEEIKKLDIPSISDENSVIFLWTIQAYLPYSFDLLKNWGFKYQRVLTWDKQNGMCLFGFHHRTEFVVFGYKGKIEMYPRRRAIPTVFSGKSDRHSAKPDNFYDLVSVFGKPRIDLFARKQRRGWDVWGDEVESDPLVLRGINTKRAIDTK